MRKRKLKAWVQNALYVIIGCNMIVLAADSESMLVFIVSKIIALLTIVICLMVLGKWGKF